MPGFVDFQAVKEHVSIERAAEMLKLKLKQSGSQWRGACPACKSDERSLVVTPAKQAYFCFSAKVGGDCISLVAHVQGVAVRDAAHFLAGNGTVPVPPVGTGTSTSSPTAPQREKAGANPPKFDAEAYARSLQTDHAALEALGLTPEVCGRWKCGVAAKGVLRGRLALPVCDMSGGFKAFIGRALNEQHYAFANGFVAADHIFGADRLGPGEVHILSDPVQVIMAHESGVQAIAFLTDTVSPMQVEMLASLLDAKGCEIVF